MMSKSSELPFHLRSQWSLPLPDDLSVFGSSLLVLLTASAVVPHVQNSTLWRVNNLWAPVDGDMTRVDTQLTLPLDSAPSPGVHVSEGPHPRFSLTTPSASYIFHVDPESLELVHDHYGAQLVDPIPYDQIDISGQTGQLAILSREFPDSGRGDFRLPAIHLRNAAGCTVSELAYDKYEVSPGKPRGQGLGGLPGTFGDEKDVTTLKVFLQDEVNGVQVVLSYAVFHKLDVIARSFELKNKGQGEVVVERAESFSVDLETGDYEFVQLKGDWPREARKVRRKVDFGTQGFQSSAGYSSHFHNPFVAVVAPETGEHHGPAYGFNLIYTGSHSTSIEKGTHGPIRVLMGLNPMHLSYPLASGESFHSPECVSVFSPTAGLGGMSRTYHRLYRDHLITSPWGAKERPCLINNWEATYFDFDTSKLYDIASTASDLGVKMFVMDDGWFGKKHPRTDDHAGLGDWVVNPDRFPSGLGPFVEKVNKLSIGGKSMKFGLWVEPEMVNPKSELYETHPDWILHAPKRFRTEQRNQLVLNLSLKEVQDYLIESLSSLLSSANIEYIKWDNNRSMHELSHPSIAHKYMLGLYRVLGELTSKFPQVLWEGCASGGGRFDAGILHYFPQTWASDNTDGLERIFTQFGTSLAYPSSAMGCHVAAVPNHQMERTTPLEFRAHVAMMGGSFGFELDLGAISAEEKSQIPSIVALSEKVNPYVIHGDLYRLNTPEESNWPAAFYVDPRSGNGVLLAYQVRATIKETLPPLRLQGLDEGATYDVDGKQWSGATLMRSGLKFQWKGDYQSRCVFITRV